MPTTTHLTSEIGRTDSVVERDLAGGLAPGEVVADVEFDGCTFTGNQWERARLTRCTFTECVFVGVNASMVDLTDTRLVGARFERCKLLAVNFAALGARALAADPLRFVDCRLDLAGFQGVDLEGVVFERCSLREADFAEAVLRGASFEGSDLAGATFGRTDLRGADLSGATAYAFDVRDNRVGGLRVEPTEAARLLQVLGLRVE